MDFIDLIPTQAEETKTFIAFSIGTPGVIHRRGGAYSFVACLGHLTIRHASLSRRTTVPTPNRDASNIWALIALPSIYYIETVCLSYPRPVSPSAATIYLLG